MSRALNPKREVPFADGGDDLLNQLLCKNRRIIANKAIFYRLSGVTEQEMIAEMTAKKALSNATQGGAT